MDFAKITRTDSTIEADEWISMIEQQSYLQPIPDRTGTNPFTGEEIQVPGLGKAYYLENGTRIGNASLEEGQILTTAIPRPICEELASRLGAIVEDDDRS